MRRTGDLRFRLPQAVDAYTGTLNATAFGPACPQQSGVPPNTDGLPAEVAALFSSFNAPLPSDEDCELLIFPDSSLTLSRSSRSVDQHCQAC